MAYPVVQAVYGKKMVSKLLFVAIILVFSVHVHESAWHDEPDEGGKKDKKKAPGGGSITDEIEDDDVLEEEESVEDYGGRKDCTGDGEIEDCQDECDDNRECRRQSHSLECDNYCFEMCRYITDNTNKKCEINLIAYVAKKRYRLEHTGRGRRGGRRGGRRKKRRG